MDDFFNIYVWDIYEVLDWLLEVLRTFLSTFFDSEYSWMFNLAFLPFVLLFVTDLLFSFIFSFRSREVRFFNVLSPKSWRMYNELKSHSLNNARAADLKNHFRLFGLNKFQLSPFALRLSYKKAQAGDLIRSKDGLKSIYGGVKLSSNGSSILYKYRTNNGIYYSTLCPYKWSQSNGSQRMNSVVHKNLNKGV